MAVKHADHTPAKTWHLNSSCGLLACSRLDPPKLCSAHYVNCCVVVIQYYSEYIL